MPFIGGAAKHNYRCGGRAFTGEFDDCFNDYIPVLELGVVLFTLATGYAFYRFSRALFDLSSSTDRGDKYGLKTRPTGAHLAAAVGVVWAFWRALSYPLVPQLVLFTVFWCIFALWFGVGATYGWFGTDER